MFSQKNHWFIRHQPLMRRSFILPATLAPPVARGWEYVVAGWDFDAKLTDLPRLLATPLIAPAHAVVLTARRFRA